MLADGNTPHLLTACKVTTRLEKHKMYMYFLFLLRLVQIHVGDILFLYFIFQTALNDVSLLVGELIVFHINTKLINLGETVVFPFFFCVAT